MKIYTKTGDKGKTSLIGGLRVSKCHHRIDALGSVDELNSWLGLICSQKIDKISKNNLFVIQKNLFAIQSALAVGYDKSKKIKKPNINFLKENDLNFLEKEIDKIEKKLPALKEFVIPGGNQISSHCHIARTVCRRAERITINLSEKEKVDEFILKYLNRLSDYLFVLARKEFKV
ncbi:MAG: cob(I)yrinic acid a,c-diamide adenosyltransferase [Bacteroidales bacterium]|jgi:cob(I)alamin adenosyltransferase